MSATDLRGGVDEVGRGPLAGPVVAAAVIFERGVRLEGVRDSKKVPTRQRKELSDLIRRMAVSWAIGAATVAEVDQARRPRHDRDHLLVRQSRRVQCHLALPSFTNLLLYGSVVVAAHVRLAHAEELQIVWTQRLLGDDAQEVELPFVWSIRTNIDQRPLSFLGGLDRYVIVNDAFLRW